MDQVENKQGSSEQIAPPALQQKGLNPWLLVVISIGILALGAGVVRYITSHKEEAKRVEDVDFVPAVVAVAAVEQDFTPVISVQGLVIPTTQTKILSEVAGPITYINPSLKKGNVLDAGELLVRVNKANYELKFATAESLLADAELVLAQEMARAVQAMRDWRKLGHGKPASDLVQRKPQIKSAKARVAAANAQLRVAQMDLDKTQIRAPYRCQIEMKYIDVGSFLNVMSPVADVVSVDSREVRLSLSLDDVEILPVGDGGVKAVGTKVKLSADIGGKSHVWEGVVSRFEPAIETRSFSMILIVTVQPNDGADALFRLPPRGLFVKTSLSGKRLAKAVKIPRMALREGGRVWVISGEPGEEILSIRKVEVLRSEQGVIFLNDGVLEGEMVIVSPLSVAIDGMSLMTEPAEEELKTKVTK